MSPLTIGAKLPTRWFDRIVNRRGVRFIVRRCKECGNTYPTAEIAMHFGWPDEARPDRCRLHQHLQARVLGSRSSQTILRGGHNSSSMFTVISYGGFWRRYECPVEDCVVPDGRFAGRRMRWSTIEVSAEGVVVSDVTQCPKCLGFKTRAVMRDRARPKSLLPKRPRRAPLKCFDCGRPNYACICDLRGM